MEGGQRLEDSCSETGKQENEWGGDQSVNLQSPKVKRDMQRTVSSCIISSHAVLGHLRELSDTCNTHSTRSMEHERRISPMFGGF